MADRVIQRNDTLENWNEVNPVLAKGEIAIITDTGGYKIGNGVDNFKLLPYPQNPTQVINELGDDPGVAIAQKIVTDKFNEIDNSKVFLTEEEYEALEEKDDNVLYYLYEE